MMQVLEETYDVLLQELRRQLGPRYIVERDTVNMQQLSKEDLANFNSVAMFSIRHAGQERYLCTVFHNDAEAVTVSDPEALTAWGANASLEIMEIFRSKQMH